MSCLQKLPTPNLHLTSCCVDDTDANVIGGVAAAVVVIIVVGVVVVVDAYY